MESLEIHFDNQKELFSNGSSTTDIESIYLVGEEIPKSYLPKTSSKYPLNYINIYDKKNRKLLKKGIMAVSIQPLKLEGNKVIITLINFKISYKNQNYNFSNGGGSETYFEYSCADEKWKLLESNFSGI